MTYPNLFSFHIYIFSSHKDKGEIQFNHQWNDKFSRFIVIQASTSEVKIVEMMQEVLLKGTLLFVISLIELPGSHAVYSVVHNPNRAQVAAHFIQEFFKPIP